MDIGEKQLKIIENIKFFLNSLKFKDVDDSLSSFCYFTSWSETPGYARIKLQSDGWPFIFKYCKIILKNFLAIASHSSYKEICNNTSKKNYEVILLSWSFKKNFHSDGSFQDRYFNVNSNNLSNVFWILISIDGYVPPNLKDNIRIIKKNEGVFKYNFFSFIKIIFLTLFKYKFSLNKLYHYTFFHSYFAKFITSIVQRELKKNKFKALLVPYEAQPFQNYIFSESKKINKKILNIGYLHSLPPLTSEMVYRSGAPDLLLVHGRQQIEILKNILNWPEKSLILIKSLRFRLNDKSLSEKVYIPMSLHDQNKLINEFERLLANYDKNSFPRFEISDHPAIYKSRKHLKFKKKIEKVLEKYKDRFSKDKKNISIFLGVTAAVLEALEKGVEVFHICSDPVFQSYNEDIWKKINVTKISDCIFQYKLETKGQYIDFDKDASLYTYLNKIIDF